MPYYPPELMTSADKTKLDGIATGAEVNVNADWTSASGDSQILNKPSTFAPSSHNLLHENNGSDEMSVAGLSGLLADAQTPLTHSITTGHSFPGGTTNYLREDGTFTAPTASVAAPFVGAQATGSFSVTDGQFALQGKRLTLVSSERATLSGSGRLIILG